MTNDYWGALISPPADASPNNTATREEPHGATPRIAALVINDIRWDGRVKRAAAAAAAAGFDVLVLGRSPTGNSRVLDAHGFRAQLVAPPTSERHIHRTMELERADRRRRIRWSKARILNQKRNLANLRRRNKRMHQHATALRLESRRRRKSHRASPFVRLGRTTYIKFTTFFTRLDERLWHLRTPIYKWRHRRLVQRAHAVDVDRRWSRSLMRLKGGDTRHPLHQEYNFTDHVREELRSFLPDIIHAHDAYTLLAAIDYCDWARSTGKVVKILYDAHEYIPGLPYLAKSRRRALTQLERDFAPLLDTVITVSPPIANQLIADHGLECPVDVVHNTPILSSGGGRSLREDIGVSTSVPLLVYSGSVSPMRNIDLVVHALPKLPTVHAAFVVKDPASAPMQQLREQSAELKVEDRVHILPYVEPEHVVGYLRSADVGIIPVLPTINHEFGLANKLFEYILAELPSLVSDMPTQSRFVEEHGIGGVYKHSDAEDLVRAFNDVFSRADAIRDNMRAKNLSARFSWQAEAKHLVALYADLLGLDPSDWEPRDECLIRYCTQVLAPST